MEQYNFFLLHKWLNFITSDISSLDYRVQSISSVVVDFLLTTTIPFPRFWPRKKINQEKEKMLGGGGEMLFHFHSSVKSC